MFGHGKKRSVFFYFVCYNLIILTVPLLLNFLWYYQADKLVKDKTVENSNVLLHQSQRVIDERVRQIRDIAINVTLDGDVKKYADKTESTSGNSIYTNYQINKVFDKWISTNPYVNMIFIYYHNTQVVLSNQGNSYEVSDFFRRNGALFGGSEEEWLARIHSSASNIFLYNGNEQSNAMTYLINIPISNKKENSDKLGICLNRSIISDVFNASSLPERTLSCIIRSDGTILYADGNTQLCSLFSYDATLKNANRVVKAEDGTRFMVSHIASQEADWSYVFITPWSVYMEHSDHFRTLTTIIVLLAFITGILLSLHFARKSSRPITALSKLMDMDLSGNNLLDDPKEWRSIENAVRQRLHSANDIALHKLLFQDAPISEEHLPKELRLAFSYSRFVCAVMDIFELPEYLYGVSADDVQYVLNNVAQDVCRITGNIRVVYYAPKCYAVILNIADNIEEADDEISSFFAMFRKILWTSLSIDAFISIGSLHNSLSGISHSFAEARQMRECIPLRRDCNIICFKNFQNTGDYDYPIAQEIQMIGFLKQGNAEKALFILEQIVEQNFNRPDFTVSMAKKLFAQVQNTVTKALKDLEIRFEDIFSEDEKPFENPSANLSLEEANAILRIAFQKICAYVSEIRNDMSKRKIEKIIGYIHENYANPELSLCMISDKFHMNQAYLSTFFREQTGENFINFIRKIKIDKAKELLKDTKVTLRVIAEQTGYNSSNILIQNFKKETGITPSQYRAEILSSSNPDADGKKLS